MARPIFRVFAIWQARKRVARHNLPRGVDFTFDSVVEPVSSPSGWDFHPSHQRSTFPLLISKFLPDGIAEESTIGSCSLQSVPGFLFPLTGWVVYSDSLCAGLLGSPLFALLDTPVIPLVFVFFPMVRQS